ncbi:MAG: DMT family transporter, partial [Actinobacteria bacterium]|nr:DMT family transporter [Actinomycetota bacterium]
YLTLLFSVALIWGASYMFIKIAVDEMAPTTAMALRLVFAAAVLVPLLAVQQGPRAGARAVRATGWGGFFLGLMNTAVPFTLIAWGETHVDSGIAAIANAPLPIFVAFLAIWFQRSERVRGARLAGVLVGFAGVVVLVGFQPEGGSTAIVATLAIVAATFAYAISYVFAQARYAETQPIVLVTASSLAGALILAPFGIWQRPVEVPSAGALASVAALGVVGTSLALVLYYRMLVAYGASRASLVTYLIPPTALAYGVFLLDESLALNAIVGLVLILAGVGLGSGAVRVPWRRREPLPVAPRG